MGVPEPSSQIPPPPYTDSSPSASAYQPAQTAATPLLPQAQSPTPPPRPSAGKRHRLCLALLSGSNPKWYGRPVPRNITAIAILGGVDIDLRGAYLQPGTTKIRCIAILGGVSIRAPESFPLEVNGLGILGGFDDARRRPPSGRIRYERAPTEPPRPDPVQPTGAEVVVSGVAVLGGVSAVDHM